MENLIAKYNIPGPRYTSYPTVPFWNKEGIQKSVWIESVKQSFKESNATEGISLYIHLPFCESLCTFCGCNKRITKNHGVESPYITAVLKEWDLYLELFDEKPIISELHFGGGTPTFFAPESLDLLLSGILGKGIIPTKHSYSFEGHPNNTTRGHLEVMAKHGFRRASYGVQDFDEKVQRSINRIQSYKDVAEVTKISRELGYNSTSFDLIYGLPFQTIGSIKDTIEQVKRLMPERIAFYSYAHVPWIKGNGQRGFNDDDLPAPELKRAMYETGYRLLLEAGYKEVGMDHFALEHDEMYQSYHAKTLHRNFMGYTASKTQLMVGLGVSSISDSWYAFAQNVKTVEEYYAEIEKNEIPIFKGHLLTEEDLIIRKHILNIMCHFETDWKEEALQHKLVFEAEDRLQEMIQDGLLTIENNALSVTEKGKPFVRNICMAFDAKLLGVKPGTQLFSMTI